MRVAAISSSGDAIAGKIEHPVAHFRPSRELGDGVDLHLDFEIGHSATAPDNPDQSDIVLTAVEHNFFDETPQQRFALSIRGGWVCPDLWEAAGEVDDFAMQGLAHPHLTDGLWRGLLSKRLLGRSDLAQGRFPASLEFRGDETIVGIDTG